MEDHPLKTYRDSEDLTQAELAGRLGVSRTTVARWECGTREIGAEKLPLVSEKTGIPRAKLRPDLASLISENAA